MNRMNRKFRMKFAASVLIPTLAFGMVAMARATDGKTSAPGTKSMQGPSSGAPNIGAKTFQRSSMSNREMRVSKLIGTDVKNAQGESLGEIKDLVIDVKNSRVHYAVLAFGGFLGMGDKLFAFPVGLFSKATDGDKLILNVDKSQLKAAPGFEAKYYPDWNSAKYNTDVDRYFGSNVALKPMPNQQLRRASDLLGRDVNDRNGTDVGEIEDLVINLGTGAVRYAVLEFDKSWSLNDKLLAMPLGAFTYTREGKDLVLGIDKSKLETRRAFDKNSWPDINDSNYIQEVNRYLILVVPSAGTDRDSAPPKTSMNATPGSRP